MAKRERSEKKPPSETPVEAAPPPANRLEMVRGLIMECHQGLSGRTMTVADLTRLLSLEKELAGEERVEELRVKWVQSFETEFAS